MLWKRETSINLNAYKTEENLYTTPVSGIPGLVLVKLEQVNGRQDGIALAVFEDGNTDNPSRELTADEKALANSRGLSTANKSQVTSKPEIAAASPKIPGTSTGGIGLTLPTNGKDSLPTSLPDITGIPPPMAIPSLTGNGLSLPTTTPPTAIPASNGLSLPTTTPPTAIPASNGLSLPTTTPSTASNGLSLPTIGHDLSKLQALVTGI